MATTFQTIKQTLSALAHAVLRRVSAQMELLRDKLGEFLNIQPEYKGLVFTPEEEAAISESASILSEFFPEHPGKIMLEEDYESRCEVIEDLARQLSSLYGLEGYEVVISENPEDFSGGEDLIEFGRMTPNRMYINGILLRSDKEDVLEHLVSTVVHELRHRMQLEIALLGERKYRVPYERRRQWRQNFCDYEEGGYDYEAYFNQTIEFDARVFTERVMKSAFQ